MRIARHVTASFLSLVLWASSSAAPPARVDAPTEHAGPSESGRLEQPPVSNQLIALDRRLDDLLSRQEVLSRQFTVLEQEQARIRGELDMVVKVHESLREQTQSRLVVLYKFHQMGYAIPLLRADDGHGVLKAARLTKKLLEEDHQLFLRFFETGRKVRNLEVKLSQATEGLIALKLQIAAQAEEILSAKREKMALLSRLHQQERPADARNPETLESEGDLKKRGLSRRRIFDFGEKSFSSRQGELPLPTAGKLTATYGSKTTGSFHTILYSNGIVISAPQGQPVQAVHGGIVVFADWFKEYGKMMIISHGDHYYSLIAHADQLHKKVFDSVRAGEMIATVGHSGSLDGPALYFEIRHHGQPMDPLEWLSVQNFSEE